MSIVQRTEFKSSVPSSAGVACRLFSFVVRVPKQKYRQEVLLSDSGHFLPWYADWHFIP
jgi:hypothetical protein